MADTDKALEVLRQESAGKRSNRVAVYISTERYNALVDVFAAAVGEVERRGLLPLSVDDGYSSQVRGWQCPICLAETSSPSDNQPLHNGDYHCAAIAAVCNEVNNG